MGDNVVYETNGTDKIWYYYDASGTPVSFELNGTSYHYVKNLQGDIIAIVNDSGAKVVEYTYNSWGKLISTTGSLASTVGVKNPYRYRGYRYDTETGLYYLQSRYYDPETGRFINADASVDTGETVLSTNMFAYCENNPVNKVDKDGTFGTPIQWACAIIGAVIGIPFGKWLANKLGYYNDARYIAIRAGAIVGGAVLGWFAGSLMIRLVKNYLTSHPQTAIKIVSRYGAKTLIRFRSIFGLSMAFVNGSIYAEAITKIGANRINHILLGKHNWKVFGSNSWASVKNIILYVLENGYTKPYKAGSKLYYAQYKGYIVEVQLNYVNGAYQIVDAWVKGKK